MPHAIQFLRAQPEEEAWADALALQGGEVLVAGGMLRSHDENKVTRQLVTCDTPWPRYRTSHIPARAELPWATFTLAQVEAASGVEGNRHHEKPEVATYQSLPIMNKPAVRPEIEPSPPQTSTDKPRPGCFGDFFRRAEGDSYTFNSKDHGAWVLTRIRQLKLARTDTHKATWTVHADEFLAEIELWIATAAADLVNAATWHEHGCIGKFTAIAKTWIIPEAALAEFVHGKVFDTRAFFAASPAEREHIQIELQDWSVPDHETWDMNQIWKMGVDSGVTDMACLSDLCKNGVTLPFLGESSILLAPCSAAFFEMLEVCQETARAELLEGLLLPALQGLPLFPIKISPRSIATQFKEGKLKYRPVANLGYPQTSELHHHSVNHGYDIKNDETNFPHIDYVSPRSLAHAAATLIPICGGSFCLARNDW